MKKAPTRSQLLQYYVAPKGNQTMSKDKKSLPTISRLKQRAKALKKAQNISHSEALNKLSHEYGFQSWSDLNEFLIKQEQTSIPTPTPSTTFIEYEDVSMSEKDFAVLEKERSTELELSHKKKVNENKKVLTRLGLEFSIFEPTITGLNKSILDATQTVRSHFELENFHFYWEQKQGPDYKVVKEAILVSEFSQVKSKVSLYRPMTKQGDPRMWFRGLTKFANAGDQIAIVIDEQRALLFNLSDVCLEEQLKRESSEIGKVLTLQVKESNEVVTELLDKLRALAASQFSALRKGDTAIGYTLETMLGIEANSSKKPDYKGIELKSGRGSTNRTTLFAQVADWSLSPCKKSAEILNKYGYQREEDFKLYCTVSTQKENSQGLSFIYNQSKDQLEEWSNKSELVAVWPGDLLRNRLKEKHAETFWVEAKSEMVEGVEQFQLLSVTHTKAPIVSQLLPLIEAGVITMDHLIKRSGKTGRVSEKGPLFKMDKKNLSLLFPEPSKYDLI
ncbi:MvaI/BcnI family restriction endonuclease [Vibrio rotiferianus]|nr:MvaI/BcnI family restriction endonuclease [Vibrio rotiferianus]